MAGLAPTAGMYVILRRAFKAQSGTGSSFDRFPRDSMLMLLARGDLDVAANDIPLTTAEAAKTQPPLVQVPIAIAGTGIVYNLPSLRRPLNLSGAVLADILLGQIKNWNAPAIAAINPDAKLPSLPITVVRHDDGDPDLAVLPQFLASTSPAWARAHGEKWPERWAVGVGARGEHGIAQKVSRTSGAIGFVAYAPTVLNRVALPFAAIQNAGGKFIQPSLAAMTAAAATVAIDGNRVTPSLHNSAGRDSYPITAFTYVFARRQRDPERNARVRSFLRWATNDGQELIPTTAFAPLPANVRTAIQRSLDSLSTPRR